MLIDDENEVGEVIPLLRDEVVVDDELIKRLDAHDVVDNDVVDEIDIVVLDILHDEVDDELEVIDEIEVVKIEVIDEIDYVMI